MQVSHCRTYDQVGVGITMVKPVHDLPHEWRHLLVRRTDVRGRSAIRTSDLDTTPTVLTRLLRVEADIQPTRTGFPRPTSTSTLRIPLVVSGADAELGVERGPLRASPLIAGKSCL
jgi:hypothetical protein